MTSYDYYMTMKSVNVADLKARLSEHLRHVRRGHALTVLDRKTPIAKLIPYTDGSQSLRIRHPLGMIPRLHRVPMPQPLKLDVDIVDLLLEERQGER